MLKTKIKANSITNLTDARYFAAWEVEWLGFNLNPGESIALQQVATIKEWVDGVKIVGELSQPNLEDVNYWLQELNLSTLQIGRFTDLEVLIDLHNQVELIQEFVLESEEDLLSASHFLQERSAYANYFLLDFHKNNISWAQLSDSAKEQIHSWANQYQLLLNIKLDTSLLEELLDTTSIKGYCVQGGAEEKVGYKSFDELDKVFEAMEVLV